MMMTTDENAERVSFPLQVALTFGVALLHVLCMPRPSGWRRGTSLRPRASRRGTRSSKWIPSDEMPFILAAGVLQVCGVVIVTVSVCARG